MKIILEHHPRRVVETSSPRWQGGHKKLKAQIILRNSTRNSI